MVISGRTGPLIHYKLGDKHFIRAVPRKFTQTKATKKRASEFGHASSLGKAIRGVLKPVIPDPKDRSMHRRLIVALFEWIRQKDKPANQGNHLSFITGFKFNNDGYPFQNLFKTQIQFVKSAAGEIQIIIPDYVPEKDIKAPTGTKSVVFKFAVGSVDIRKGTSYGQAESEITTDYDGRPVPVRTITLKLDMPVESLVLLGVSMRYMLYKNNAWRENKNKGYMPSQILNALIS